MAWIYAKAYDIDSQAKKIKRLQTYEISPKILNFITNGVGNWNVELIAPD